MDLKNVRTNVRGFAALPKAHNPSRMPKQATTKAAAGSKAARIAGAAAGVAGVMSPSGACNA